MKYEYVELNHIKYGIFSTSEWRKRLAPIISNEVMNFKLDTDDKREVKKQIEGQLNVLIDKVNQKIKEKNKKSIRGNLKQMFLNIFVDIEEIKKGIPEYADAIIAQMTRPTNARKIKSMLKEKIDVYFQKTFQERDLNSRNKIIESMGTPDIEIARVKLADSIDQNERMIFMAMWVLIFLSLVIFSLVWMNKEPLPVNRYFFLLINLFILLVAGVTTPMIDMDAKITEMSFVLMDQTVSFTNQVLYFQSKSVLDVFWLMITHKKPEMKLVGVLVVMFSVFFPLLKMVSSLIYYFDLRNLKANRWIQFFVLKSGKWSMADVTVVAIFMAYVGFNGVISSQIGKLNALSDEMEFLTTNGTSLQPGFFMFLSYALLGLVFSSLVATAPSPQKKPKSKSRPSTYFLPVREL